VPFILKLRQQGSYRRLKNLVNNSLSFAGGFKTGNCFFFLKMEHLYRNMSEMRLHYL